MKEMTEEELYNFYFYNLSHYYRSFGGQIPENISEIIKQQIEEHLKRNNSQTKTKVR